MTYGNPNAQAYRQVYNHSAQYADPHQLVAMLMDGVIVRAAAARTAIEQRDIESKALEINKAVAILNGLRDTLDFDKGGDIAGNLEALYDYMQNRLMQASARMDVEPVDEVCQLMREIKSGWGGIEEEARRLENAAHSAEDSGEAPRLNVSG